MPNTECGAARRYKYPGSLRRADGCLRKDKKSQSEIRKIRAASKPGPKHAVLKGVGNAGCGPNRKYTYPRHVLRKDGCLKKPKALSKEDRALIRKIRAGTM